MPRLLRTSNMALNDKTFEGHQVVADEAAMTLQGTVNKTGILLVVAFLASAWTWGMARSQPPEAVLPWILGAGFAGFLVALLTIARKDLSPLTAPSYAVLEGLVVGGVSSLLDIRFPGIAIHAVGLTFGTLAILLVAYTTGLVRPNEKLTIGIVAATGAIAVVYIVDLGLRFFGRQVPLINDAGPWGIAVSLLIVAVAALNLILDFDFVRTGVEGHAAKYMEWYGAFGIMVTLVWMYLEILRLLSKVRQR